MTSIDEGHQLRDLQQRLEKLSTMQKLIEQQMEVLRANFGRWGTASGLMLQFLRQASEAARDLQTELYVDYGKLALQQAPKEEPSPLVKLSEKK